MTQILALDPATSTGVAHSDGLRTVWHLGKSGGHPGSRLVRLRELLLETAMEHPFDLLASEDASFGSHNPAVQAFHNQLRGIILGVACELNVPVRLFKPNTIKKFATGSGRAKKADVIRAAEKFFGVVTESDDLADALFVLELARQDYQTEKRLKRGTRKVTKAKVPKLF